MNSEKNHNHAETKVLERRTAVTAVNEAAVMLVVQLISF